VFPATPAPKFFEVFVDEVGGWAFHSFWSPVGCRADRSNLISLRAVDFLCFYFTLYSVAVAPPVDFTFSVQIHHLWTKLFCTGLLWSPQRCINEASFPKNNNQ
jgi:hypothetical protein